MLKESEILENKHRNTLEEAERILRELQESPDLETQKQKTYIAAERTRIIELKNQLREFEGSREEFLQAEEESFAAARLFAREVGINEPCG